MLYLINENACVFIYLSTGLSFRSLDISFRMNDDTAGKMVDQVSDVLWSKLLSKHLTFILLMWRIGRAPNSIPIYSYIQQDATLQFIYIWKLLYMFRVVLSPIIRSTYNCIYNIWYLSQHSYCYLPLSWKRWNRFECAVDGVHHPQHTQTGSNSSTIAADSSNGVKNTRCCRYSCMRS
jgi:hypothetical protein